MARIINGTLLVPSFDATVNPGEYTITGASYDNQADATGNGAADLVTGFILYVPASDPNTFTLLPGVAHRYKITALTVVDTFTINATVLWDEGGSEVDAPTNGAYCIISESTTSQKFGLPASVGVYSNLPAGVDIAALDADIRHITDSLTGGGGGSGEALETSMNNGSGATLTALTPVRGDTSGKANTVDVATEAQAFAIVGITKASISNGSDGTIVIGGRLKNITTSAVFGDKLFVSKTGGVTATKPDIGSGGFVAGDFVIEMGVIVRNNTVITNKDLDVNIRVVGQL